MSGQNYIGSKISLISLSDIRYVGVLHNINPVDSTVSLQKVKSFGTEGRKGNPSEEIPASDNVFDYVVFRGTDIKDLQVFEAPPSFQPSSSSQQMYGSISETTSGANQSQYYLNKPYEPNMAYAYDNNYWQYAAYPAQQPNHLYQSSQHQFQQQPHLEPSSQVGLKMPVPEDYQEIAKNNAMASPETKSSNTINGNDTHRVEEKTIVSTPKENVDVSSPESSLIQEKKAIEEKNTDDILVDALVKQVSELDIKQPYFSKQHRPTKPPQQKNKESGSKHTKRVNNKQAHSKSATVVSTDASSPSKARRNSNNINKDNEKNPGHVRHNSRGILIPKSDFDFASANAKFNKNSDLLNENDTNVQASIGSDHFYDKKKSFFDDISCESKEHQNGHRGGKYKEESKLNLETFGQATLSGQSAKRSRHRHRGNRGKGRSKHQNSEQNKKEIKV
ncbi:Scd6-like Sm domain-containing protein [Choanephora cucurbitarum]|nr:Scd6-like Sm domain-containing protein [Choanephora cucurbitarum]